MSWLSFHSYKNIQCSFFITLCFGSIGMDCVITVTCYKGTILQKNYRKMTIPLSNFMVENIWESQHDSTGPRSAVGKMPDCRSSGRKFEPPLVPYFLEIDHEIISTAILLPSADSRRVVVSYKGKYVHKLL